MYKERSGVESASEQAQDGSHCRTGFAASGTQHTEEGLAERRLSVSVTQHFAMGWSRCPSRCQPTRFLFAWTHGSSGSAWPSYQYKALGGDGMKVPPG